MTKLNVQFRPPSNVSPERYTSLWTESKAVGELLQSTREELLAYGEQLLKQAVEDHFLEHGLDLDSLGHHLLVMSPHRSHICECPIFYALTMFLPY